LHLLHLEAEPLGCFNFSHLVHPFSLFESRKLHHIRLIDCCICI